MSMQLKINVPYAKDFDDYHDIDHHMDEINSVGTDGHCLKSYECGFSGRYYGIFYVGRRPSCSEMMDIVQRDCGLSDEEMKEIEWVWRR
jgi:hypothetical protein